LLDLPSNKQRVHFMEVQKQHAKSKHELVQRWVRRLVSPPQL
jgi:hypothetical protein